MVEVSTLLERALEARVRELEAELATLRAPKCANCKQPQDQGRPDGVHICWFTPEQSRAADLTNAPIIAAKERHG